MKLPLHSHPFPAWWWVLPGLSCLALMVQVWMNKRTVAYYAGMRQRDEAKTQAAVQAQIWAIGKDVKDVGKALRTVGEQIESAVTDIAGASKLLTYGESIVSATQKLTSVNKQLLELEERLTGQNDLQAVRLQMKEIRDLVARFTNVPANANAISGRVQIGGQISSSLEIMMDHWEKAKQKLDGQAKDLAKGAAKS